MKLDDIIKMLFCCALIFVYSLFAFSVNAQGTDYLYVRTYDAQGNVIKRGRQQVVSIHICFNFRV